MLKPDSPLLRRAARPDPEVRLVCFPYAGAGASMYAAWPELLPDTVELVAVQLPGREDRLFDPVSSDVAAIARTVAVTLRPYFSVPVVFFGHCAGALLAYEVASTSAERFGVQPAQLVVSGLGAPDLPRQWPALHTLPDAELRAELRGWGAAPQQVLDDDDFMDLLLPGVRADFALWDGYRYRPRPPLTCPVTVFGGTDDERAGAEELEAWRAHTDGPFARRMFPGGHFFVDELREDVTAAVCGLLGHAPPEATRAVAAGATGGPA
ncbi:alpha/beta fold hydrolase [Streptomyces sp. NPDC005760]|uniref:thioesterase II family protein n=1 Tax=Streptomyces sp. NPDC005760 TaxID=3156718 RepID=UPI0033F569CD